MSKIFSYSELNSYKWEMRIPICEEVTNSRFNPLPNLQINHRKLHVCKIPADCRNCKLAKTCNYDSCKVKVSSEKVKYQRQENTHGNSYGIKLKEDQENKLEKLFT